MTGSQVRYESIPCNLCGVDDPEVVLPALTPERNRESLEYAASGDAPLHDRLVRCKHCGLVYVSPRPQRKAIESAYEEVDNSLYVEQGDERGDTFVRAVRWLERQRIPKGKLLDVGCAGGFFVKAAQDAGWDATGIELSKHLADYGRQHLGVNIVQGTLESVSFPEHSFDLVSFWDVLEHVADPTDALRRAHRLLRPGGVLLVNCPDYASVFARLLGRRWWFLIDVHIFYFTPKTLKKLFEKCGFQPLKQRYHLQTLRFGYLARRIESIFPLFGNLLKGLARASGLEKLPITYYASQKTVIGRVLAK